MTWAKYGNEFCARMRQRRLSDAARATHFEAIHYLYQVEQSDCRFYKDMLPVVAASPHRDSAAQELIRAGYWRDVGECFEVIDHGDVLRQSLVAQSNKLARDRRAKAKHRGKVEGGSASSDAAGSADGDDATDRQSDSREVEEQPHVPKQASEPWPEVALPGARDTWRKAARGYET